MAKKVDNASSQGNQYFNSLMQNRPAVPLETPAETKPADLKPVPAATPAASVKEEPAPKKREIKTRCSFALYPSEMKDLKHIAYMTRIPVSNIIREYVVNYIRLHKADLEAFDKLSEDEKMRVDDTKLW